MTFPVKLAGGAMLLWLLNYFAAVYAHYPILWCAGNALLRPLVAPWASIVLLLMCAYWFYSMVRYGVLSGNSMMAVFMVFLIGGAEGFARILLFANSPNACG